MGMFDSIRLDNIELPDLRRTDPLEEYQTKDLDCNLDSYRVTADGRLVVRRRGDHDEKPVCFAPTSFSGVILARGDRHDLRLGFNSGHLWSVAFA